MPLVGAVAVPHSHLQLFTRPSESDEYRRQVQKGREAMFRIREYVEGCRPDTILLIHDDHFLNFDFRCYPPFALHVGREAKGNGVMDPAEIERITGATYRRYGDGAAYDSAPKGIPQHMADWSEQKPYVYEVDTDLGVRMLKELVARGFDMPFTSNGTMDGELVLTTNFLNPKADKRVVLMLTNGYVPPLPWPRRCWQLGEALREIVDASGTRVLVLASGGMSHYPGTPLYGDVDDAFDRKVLDWLANGEARRLAELTPDELMLHGNGELVNWIVAAGMTGGVPATVVEYVRLWHIGLGYVCWKV